VLLRDGQPVPLTPKAFDLLAALVAQPGRLISKEDLLNEVWPGTFVEESNLAYNVFALRKALGDPAENGQYIATVPKRGYRFTATVTPANPANAGQPSSRFSILAGGNQEPAPPSRLTTSVLPDVEKTVLPFLRKDPARRYQTMADAKVVLEDLDSNSTGTAQSHVPPRSFAFSRRWALLLLAPVLAAGYFVVQSQRMSNETLHALPLTSLQGVMRSPSLSPDGSFVVFSWTGPKQDNPDIYVQQIGAGSPHRLTNDLSNGLLMGARLHFCVARRLEA
jgi:DNA-binding winged helix-turn-helix (wHTH) protein